MTDLMLTGRSYSAQEGQHYGLSQYLAPSGEAVKQAIELARRIAANAPLSNYAIIQALPRVARMSGEDGLFTESLIAGITSADDEAKARMRAFVEGRGKKVNR
jgi:(methylthio)acryloyl-CoA hydratase